MILIQNFLYLFFVKIRPRVVLDDAVDKNCFLDCKQNNFLCLKNPILWRKPIVLEREFEFSFICSS